VYHNHNTPLKEVVENLTRAVHIELPASLNKALKLRKNFSVGFRPGE
jgi:hypothetical protein